MPAPTSPSRRRLWTFRILTGITAALVLLALPNLLAPWLDINLNEGLQHPELERWHAAVEASGDAAAFIALLVLLRRPAGNPMLAVSFAVSALVATLMVLPFTGPLLLAILVPVALVVVSYPYWSVRGLRRADVRPVRPLLAVSVLGAAALVAPVTTALQRQIAGVGEMAVTNQWATYAEHCTTLALTALLASLGLPGWRVMAGTLAARCVYLGAVATALPTQPDSWGVPGGAAALVVGVVAAYSAIAARRPSVSGARRRLTVAGVAAAAAGTVVAAAVAFTGTAPAAASPSGAVGSTASTTRSGETLHLVAKDGIVTAIDLGTKGFGTGDQYVLSDTLYRDGRRVGRDAATCTVVTAEGDSICDLVLVLPEGHVMVRGLLPASPGTIRLAVTGGTGRYATARGDVVLIQKESSSDLTVRLAP
jgi:hypothetical protein